MFGLFKKKKKTLLDDFNEIAFGKGSKKTANLNQAIEFAHNELLQGLVNKKQVSDLANALYEGPMPYSTNDLAFSIALNFFRKDSLKETLEPVQLEARMKLLELLQANKINPLLASAFEDSLYKRFKPGMEWSWKH